MDVLYIPQLDEGDAGESPTAGRYRLLKRTPEDGVVVLTDRAVTRIEVTTDDPIRIVVPPLVKGAVRDFFVRLVVTSDEVPELTFAAPSGETISFEDVDADVFACEVGINVYAFTETDQGIFIVNRKTANIDHRVEFDPCGGQVDRTAGTFKLGAKYVSLPIPTRDGHVFGGWFTEAEGGVGVTEDDRCKSGVTRLYAHWEVYVDPFASAICPAGNLAFFSDSAYPWRVDETVCWSAPGSAKSGPISHSGVTSLTTRVSGRGTLSFKWKTSSEQNYDKLHLYIDGAEAASISGTTNWAAYEQLIEDGGSHTVEWRYTKDGTVSSGSDCGWVDDVAWTPEG